MLGRGQARQQFYCCVNRQLKPDYPAQNDVRSSIFYLAKLASIPSAGTACHTVCK